MILTGNPINTLSTLNLAALCDRKHYSHGHCRIEEETFWFTNNVEPGSPKWCSWNLKLKFKIVHNKKRKGNKAGVQSDVEYVIVYLYIWSNHLTVYKVRVWHEALRRLDGVVVYCSLEWMYLRRSTTRVEYKYSLSYEEINLTNFLLTAMLALTS